MSPVSTSFCRRPLRYFISHLHLSPTKSFTVLWWWFILSTSKPTKPLTVTLLDPPVRLLRKVGGRIHFRPCLEVNAETNPTKCNAGANQGRGSHYPVNKADLNGQIP